MKKFALLVFLVFAPAAWACYQIKDSPVTLHNSDINVHFAYIGEAMADVPVTLWSSKKGTTARVNTDKHGWAVSKDVPAGKYTVTLHSASFESFDVVLDRIGTVKTSMAVHFHTFDYCRTVRITVHLH